MYHIKNKVQLIGTVVENPIVADTQDNGKHARLSMRTTEKVKTETEYNLN
jgi:single-stranded DNA-binding protein